MRDHTEIVPTRGRLALLAMTAGLALWSGIDAPAAQATRFTAMLLPAPDEVRFAGETDSNSPAVWDRVDGSLTLFVMNSWGGQAEVTAGARLQRLSKLGSINWDGAAPLGGTWMEAVIADESGAWYGYYHNERADPACPGSTRVMPRIGAARSRDRGATWQDLGPIIEPSPGAIRCATSNHYFLGGVGDFSAVLDRDAQFLHLLYTQYLEPGGVGVAVARMAWASRDQPSGAVDVWNAGTWLPARWIDVTPEHPIGAEEETVSAGVWLYPPATPVHPAANSWDDGARGVDVWWGPSVHWNVALDAWVMLLNRATSDTWHQQGIYVSYNADVTNPAEWTAPAPLLEGGQWYPQVIGLEPGRGTDKEAGALARFFMSGRSTHLIRFARN